MSTKELLTCLPTYIYEQVSKVARYGKVSTVMRGKELLDPGPELSELPQFSGGGVEGGGGEGRGSGGDEEQSHSE